jgi:hypothetical protein
MPDDSMHAFTSAGDRYTVGAFDGQIITRIGSVTQFGNPSRWLPVTRTEGTLGITGQPQSQCIIDPGGIK